MSEFTKTMGVTAPPFHPRCRGCTAPYFNDEFTINERRAARGEDGKYQLVLSDMSFKEWKAEFVRADAKADGGLGAKIGDGKEIPLCGGTSCPRCGADAASQRSERRGNHINGAGKRAL